MAAKTPHSLLEPRDYYKPFAYPWAHTAFKTMRAMAWEPHEAPMMDDIIDWKLKLTDSERSLLTQLFRFFTQADVDVARGYVEKYLPRFPHPEIRMMLLAFGDAEANHIDAYSTLIDTLGIPETEYKAFQQYEAMRNKHEYMFERETGRSIADLLVDMAVFSAFGEGMQLFSSFALLMSFQRRKLMKGMTTIVEWSIRDETHHVESMVKLFHALVAEHRRSWNDETKKRVYDACRRMVELEDAFIDQAFSLGEVEGVTAEETKRYIRYIADRRLLQLGLKPNYGQKENPFDWLDWIMNAPTHTNFFEQRSTEYSKGEIHGWDKAWAFLDRKSPNFAPKFRVYTKPGCPHCDRAKQALLDAGAPFEAVELVEAAERQEQFARLEWDWNTPGWKTSPMIFALDEHRNEHEFVGGADALEAYLSSDVQVRAELPMDLSVFTPKAA